MRALTAILLLGAVVASGCGGNDDGTAVAGDAPPAAEGRLVVLEQRPPLPIYIEGSVGFVRVVVPGGAVVFDDRVPASRRLTMTAFDRRLPAGPYHVSSWQRPCSGNCGYLDPPRDRCGSDVDVRAGERAVVVVRLGQRGGCTIVSR